MMRHRSTLMIVLVCFFSLPLYANAATEHEKAMVKAAEATKIRDKENVEGRNKRVLSLGIPQNQLVVWWGNEGGNKFRFGESDGNLISIIAVAPNSCDNKGRAGASAGATDYDYFETLNVRFHDSMKLYEPPYSPPVKGDYETSGEYQRRLSTTRTEYNAQVAAVKQKLNNELNTRMEDNMRREFGAPAICDVTYDADKARFTLAITATSVPYQVTTQYAVSRDKAPSIKDKLKNGAPTVVFSFANDRMVLRDAFILSGTEVLPLQIVGTTQIPVQFTSEHADVSRKRLEKARAAQEQERERERAAQQQQIRRTQCAVMSNPRARYAAGCD